MAYLLVGIGTVVTAALWVVSILFFSRTLKDSAEKRSQVRKRLQGNTLISTRIWLIRSSPTDEDYAERSEKARDYRLAVRSTAIQLLIVAAVTALIGIASISKMPHPAISIFVVLIGAPLIGLYAFYIYFLFILIDHDCDEHINCRG